MTSVIQSVVRFKRGIFCGLATAAILVVGGSTGVRGQAVDAPAAPHTVIAVGGTAQAGTQFTVNIDLESGGDEVAGSFTVNFDPAKLSISNISSPQANPDVTLGSGVPAGTALTVNATQAASGRVGILVDSTNAFTASPPNRQVVRLRFTIAAGASAGSTPITFGNTPTPRSFSDALGNPIPMTYVDGSINIQAAAPPITVSGRITANGVGLRNALVTMVDGSNNRRAATSSTFGYYIFQNVTPGIQYTITVGSRRYTFTPAQITPTADSTVNFTTP